MICFYFTLLGAFAGVVKGAAVFARFMVHDRLTTQFQESNDQ